MTRSTSFSLSLFVVVVLVACTCQAFVPISPSTTSTTTKTSTTTTTTSLGMFNWNENLIKRAREQRSADFGDRVVELVRPLGLILDQDEYANVYVKAMAPKGNAARSGKVSTQTNKQTNKKKERNTCLCVCAARIVGVNDHHLTRFVSFFFLFVSLVWWMGLFSFAWNDFWIGPRG